MPLVINKKLKDTVEARDLLPLEKTSRKEILFIRSVFFMTSRTVCLSTIIILNRLLFGMLKVLKSIHFICLYSRKSLTKFRTYIILKERIAEVRSVMVRTVLHTIKSDWQ